MDAGLLLPVSETGTLKPGWRVLVIRKGTSFWINSFTRFSTSWFLRRVDLYSLHRDGYRCHSTIVLHIQPHLNYRIWIDLDITFVYCPPTPWTCPIFGQEEIKIQKGEVTAHKLTSNFVTETKWESFCVSSSFFQSNSIECGLLIMLKWQVWFFYV